MFEVTWMAPDVVGLTIIVPPVPPVKVMLPYPFSVPATTWNFINAFSMRS